MTEQMYSAEEAAQILGLQVRTVRNYVREGRLPGVRIGKQYRIARADLEAFTGGVAGTRGSDVVERVAEQPATAGVAAAEVSSVVDLDGVGAAAGERLERTLLAASIAEQGARSLRVEPFYDEHRRRLRVIIVGGATETAEMLRLIALFGPDR
ncbi:MAG: helix-turn-helix domain-containing protein [Acidobacteriota bacterium]|nr:helix-turn-helix domain-containing protein [Acidobacteriota bacterium]